MKATLKVTHYKTVEITEEQIQAYRHKELISDLYTPKDEITEAVEEYLQNDEYALVTADLYPDEWEWEITKVTD